MKINNIYSIIHKLTVALAVLILCFPTLLRADPVHVEVLVFSHSIPSIEDDEWFQNKFKVIKVRKSDELEDETSKTSEKESTIKPERATRLTRMAKIIEDHPNYQLLNYLSWIQEPERKSRTSPVYLDIEHPGTSIDPQYLLSGIVSIYEVQRLLQFKIDAIYRPFPDQKREFIFVPEEISRVTRKSEFRLQELRQVRIDEIHYFDHPKFSAIVSIVRPPKPEIYAQ